MSGHSATVMVLVLGDTLMPIAQLGPDFLILKEPAAAPCQAASPAVIHLTVNGTLETIPVHLPSGIGAATRRVSLAETGAPALSL